MKEYLGLPRLRRRPRKRHGWPEPTLTDGQLRSAWRVIGLLLEYPDEPLYAALGELRHASATLPPAVAEPLTRALDAMAGRSLLDLQMDFVDTFDTTRRCALHLTYFAFGETRKRGIALVRFKQAFRRAGLEVTADELPDHLAVVLDFGASGDPAVAWRLLNDHRAGIEILHLGLERRGSLFTDVVEALRATLPTLEGDQRQAVADLLAQGPPDEEVGLDGYALDPLLNPHPAHDPEALEV